MSIDLNFYPIPTKIFFSGYNSQDVNIMICRVEIHRAWKVKPKIRSYSTLILTRNVGLRMLYYDVQHRFLASITFTYLEKKF